jgi:hypothetical protein
MEAATSAVFSSTLADLFAKGPIEITLLGGNGRRVKMGIAAPPEPCTCASKRAKQPLSAGIQRCRRCGPGAS